MYNTLVDSLCPFVQMRIHNYVRLSLISVHSNKWTSQGFICLIV